MRGPVGGDACGKVIERIGATRQVGGEVPLCGKRLGGDQQAGQVESIGGVGHDGPEHVPGLAAHDPIVAPGTVFPGDDVARRPERPPSHPAKGEQVTYVIAFPCVDVKDKSCIEECPVDCIYEGDRMLYIQPDECVDCGACEPVCPVEAIFYEDDVPEEWNDYTAANAEFFADLGSPGGAAKLGAQDFDAPLLATVARKESES